MSRAKLARKSTSVDMTAMCDVAFLLLSYFIIVAHFKRPAAIEIENPGSVYTKIAEKTNVVMVTMDKLGKVYFSVSDVNTDEKKSIIDEIDQSQHIGLSDAEKANFIKNPTAYIGASFAQLKSFLQYSPQQLKSVNLSGIPVTDSLHNELTLWVRAAVNAFTGKKINLVVNGDNAARYPAFSGILLAMKKNDQLKFQLITSPVAPPAGSELEKKQLETGNKKVE